jgi:hypothetical protein
MSKVEHLVVFGNVGFVDAASNVLMLDGRLSIPIH